MIGRLDVRMHECRYVFPGDLNVVQDLEGSDGLADVLVDFGIGKLDADFLIGGVDRFG